MRKRWRWVSGAPPARTGTNGARWIALQLACQWFLSAQVQELIPAKAFRFEHCASTSLLVENKVASLGPLEVHIVPDFWWHGSAFAREPAQLELKPCLHLCQVWEIHSRRGTRHGGLAVLATRLRGGPKLAMPLHLCPALQERQRTTHPPWFAGSRLLPAFQLWRVADATHTIPVTEHLLRLCKGTWCRIFTPALLLVKLAHASFHIAEYRAAFAKHGVTH